jgi:hypothetical protein
MTAALGVVLAVWLAAQAGAPTPAPTPTPTPTASPAPTPAATARPSPRPRAASRITPAQADVLVREIGGKVEELRRLRFKTPVTMQVVDSGAAREAFKCKISPEAEQELRHTTSAFVQLGLVPRSADLYKRILEVAEKDVQGYYEHGTKTFYLLDHVSADGVRPVIAHELTHALEDQHYDFAGLAGRATSDDHATAIRALIEGSATVVMLAFLSREQGDAKASEELERTESERVERLRIAPSFTQRSLVLPYILGFTFLLRGKPWGWITEGGVYLSDLERAFASPPVSTRQILHPEQYWKDGPLLPPPRLTLPDLSSTLGPGWAKASEGAIGELGLSVLTGSNRPLALPWALLPSRWTNDAAVGTVGDTYHHYVNGERRLTLLLTRWETERDAEEFERALVVKGRYYFRFGVNYLILAGDYGERAEALALAAFQGQRFYADR